MSETEHLLRSPKNAARLRQAIADMNRHYQAILTEETERGILPEEQRLLDRL